MTSAIRKAVNNLPGYNTTRLQDQGLSGIDDPSLLPEVNRLRTPILTFDRDFTDPVRFRICTHPGVLWVHMSSQRPLHVAPRLQRFLRSEYDKKCKHALVELRDNVAVVTSRKGQEPEIRYYSD